MPYFVYRITRTSTGGIRGLELLGRHEGYRDARAVVREKRAQATDTREEYKMVFAEGEAEAETRLKEAREAPVLKEWEK